MCQRYEDERAIYDMIKEPQAVHDELDDDDLETLLAIAKNGQCGRITPREIRLLVEAYQSQKRQREAVSDLVASKP
jgi:hypothetical protein